jgi:anti-sigma B factor antagonist
MRINLTIQKGRVKARLSDSLDIANVALARDHLSQVLQGGDACELNLAGITEFDTAGVQLLLAFLRDARAQGKACEFVQPSASVLEATRLLGLDTSLFSSGDQFLRGNHGS